MGKPGTRDSGVEKCVVEGCNKPRMHTRGFSRGDKCRAHKREADPYWQAWRARQAALKDR